ncbi:MAG TPA: glutathione S-transferase family protein [Polyangiaceae bacterium]|nr:glutathione S-transferase family protein [Polyangiaceae bacterium]
MKLYDVKGSPNCFKVRVLARELGLTLELVPIDLSQPKSADHLARNPTGKVPTFIDDDGFVLWESAAILIHLAEKRPDARLLPSEAHARAEVMRSLFFAATHIQPWLSVLGQERIVKARRAEPADVGVLTLAERELSRFLSILEEGLAERDYLANEFSLADIAVGCTLEYCESRGFELSAYPKLVAWRERLRRRPSWRE